MCNGFTLNSVTPIRASYLTIRRL